MVVLCYTGNFPVLSQTASRLLPSTGLLAVLALWPVVIVVGLYAVVAQIRGRAWGPAVLVASALVVAAPPLIPWGDVWIDSQVALHRAALDDLAARRTAGEWMYGADLKGTLALLDTDGKVEQPCGIPTSQGHPCVLFLQVWTSWDKDQAVGLAWFPVPPTNESRVPTASGDERTPTRDLGGGWWWVDCRRPEGCLPAG